MTTIFKYPCRVRDGRFAIQIHDGAQPIAVQMQYNVPHFWALVDTSAPKGPRWFRWYGTGHDVDESERPIYLGTVQIDVYVWHLFQVWPTDVEREKGEKTPAGFEPGGEAEQMAKEMIK